MKHKQYIICLLDLYNNRKQRGLFYLKTSMPLVEIGCKFGIPGRLKKLLSNRWELHFNEVDIEQSTMTSDSVSSSVVGTLKKIMEALETNAQLESRTILLPAHTPPGAHHDD